jgi:hypothetical protein
MGDIGSQNIHAGFPILNALSIRPRGQPFGIPERKRANHDSKEWISRKYVRRDWMLNSEPVLSDSLLGYNANERRVLFILKQLKERIQETSQSILTSRMKATLSRIPEAAISQTDSSDEFNGGETWSFESRYRTMATTPVTNVALSDDKSIEMETQAQHEEKNCNRIRELEAQLKTALARIEQLGKAQEGKSSRT